MYRKTCQTRTLCFVAMTSVRGRQPTDKRDAQAKDEHEHFHAFAHLLTESLSDRPTKYYRLSNQQNIRSSCSSMSSGDRNQPQQVVIFLDIDGVLLPFPAAQQPSLFPKSTMHALQRLLVATNFPHECQIVLSSTWRVREDYIRDILDALQDFGIPIHGFYSITDPHLHSERQWEIYDWLQTNTSIEAWLALDDEDLLDGEVNEKHRDVFQGHVIQTKSSEGLTMKDVDEAIRLWNVQLRKVNSNR